MYDVDAVVNLLALQEWVEVVQEGAEVSLPVSVGHHDGRMVLRLTVRGRVVTPWSHKRVLLLDLFQCGRG